MIDHNAMKDFDASFTTERQLGGELKERQVKHGANWYRITFAWHLMENNHRYYYVYVYRNGYSKCVHQWGWIADMEGNFLQWAF
jgi:hypothetical protein